MKTPYEYEEENKALLERIKRLEEALAEKSWDNEYYRQLEEDTERSVWR